MGKNNESSGMGTVMKVFIGVVLAGIVLIVFACGGSYFFFKKAVQMTTQPAEVTAMADTIAKISAPEGYQPKMGMSLGMGIAMKMVGFEKKTPNEGSLMLMEMTVPGKMSDQELRSSFRQKAEQNKGGEEPITVTSTESKTVSIDGQDRSFDFITGETTTSKKPVHEVAGTFPAKGGMGFLVLRETGDGWDEAKIMTMLQSISTK